MSYLHKSPKPKDAKINKHRGPRKQANIHNLEQRISKFVGIFALINT